MLVGGWNHAELTTPQNPSTSPFIRLSVRPGERTERGLNIYLNNKMRRRRRRRSIKRKESKYLQSIIKRRSGNDWRWCSGKGKGNKKLVHPLWCLNREPKSETFSTPCRVARSVVSCHSPSTTAFSYSSAEKTAKEGTTNSMSFDNGTDRDDGGRCSWEWEFGTTSATSTCPCQMVLLVHRHRHPTSLPVSSFCRCSVGQWMGSSSQSVVFSPWKANSTGYDRFRGSFRRKSVRLRGWVKKGRVRKGKSCCFRKAKGCRL